VLVALASAKGSPGVTTTARVLASVWPTQAVLVDADPAGGDVALVARTATQEPLDPERGLLSLAVDARRGAEAVSLDPHLQEIDGGLQVLCGVQRPEQVAGMGPVWSAIGTTLSRHLGTVVVDVGRLAVGSPVTPVVTAADVLVFVARPTVESYAHLRERLSWIAAMESAGSVPPPVGVVVVTDARDSRSTKDLSALLGHSGLSAQVLGTVANDPRAADVVAGRLDRGIDRSLLVRSVRSLVEPVRSLANTRQPGLVTR
jgi:MinD-like ATPase involved in chromosome partitioning or flagellar assembly